MSVTYYRKLQYPVNTIYKNVIINLFFFSAESQSLCHPNPCHGGGTCEEHDGVFTCYCPEGLTGSQCQHDVTKPNISVASFVGDSLVGVITPGNILKEPLLCISTSSLSMHSHWKMMKKVLFPSCVQEAHEEKRRKRKKKVYHFPMFMIVFDHANAWASISLLVQIHNKPLHDMEWPF